MNTQPEIVQSILETGEMWLEPYAGLVILFLEIVGVTVIAVTGVRGVYNYIKGNPKTKLILAEGLTMGLEFKLGGEILRTVLVRSLEEIAIVGGIIVLRVALTVLLHWEMKNEKEELEAIEGPSEPVEKKEK